MGRETLGIDGGTIKGGSGTRIRLGLQGSGADMAERRKEGARDFRREVGEGSARWDRAVSGVREGKAPRAGALGAERRGWVGRKPAQAGRGREATGPSPSGQKGTGVGWAGAHAGREAGWLGRAGLAGLAAPFFFSFFFSVFELF